MADQTHDRDTGFNSDVSQILNSILQRQNDVEKVQATHEQVLTNLVRGSAELVDKINRVEEGIHTRFDKMEERQRFPVGHLLAFLGVVVTLMGFMVAGGAYYMQLANEPDKMRLTNLEEHQQVHVETYTEHQKAQNTQEVHYNGRLSILDTTIKQNKIYVDNIRSDVKDLNSRMRHVENKMCNDCTCDDNSIKTQ